jgi:hypothetical protein
VTFHRSFRRDEHGFGPIAWALLGLLGIFVVVPLIAVVIKFVLPAALAAFGAYVLVVQKREMFGLLLIGMGVVLWFVL